MLRHREAVETRERIVRGVHCRLQVVVNLGSHETAVVSNQGNKASELHVVRTRGSTILVVACIVQQILRDTLHNSVGIAQTSDGQTVCSRRCGLGGISRNRCIGSAFNSTG